MVLAIVIVLTLSLNNQLILNPEDLISLSLVVNMPEKVGQWKKLIGDTCEAELGGVGGARSLFLCVMFCR